MSTTSPSTLEPRSGGPAEPRDPTLPGAGTIRCGTLSYTRRGLVALCAWLLWGDFCFTLMETVVPSILPLKLKSLDSPNTLISLIMTTLPGLFNVTITPWLSFKSDRHRGPWGRRLPFILYTMPFLTCALVAMGFSNEIGAWIQTRWFSGSNIQQTQVIIILLAVFAAAFDLFNMFVNTVYWYLFNDVVPEAWMGRFMGWFRLVGVLTSAAYNFFIFQYAESHMREIFLGAALLYLFGFGLMSLKVREGEYPPLSGDETRVGFLTKVSQFARECFTNRYYWYIFLTYTFISMAGCMGVFSVFFLKSLGLTTGDMGKMGAAATITVPACLLFTGYIVDRFHPVRVSAYLAAYDAFFVLGNWVWLVIPLPSTTLLFWVTALNGAVFRALFQATKDNAEMTRLMRLLPRDKYGQYSGAMAMVRAVAIMLGGLLAGLYLDLWHRLLPDGNMVYRLNFLYSAPLALLAFTFHYLTFRGWKRLGADAAYVPPDISVKVGALGPHPDATSTVPWKLVSITALAILGPLLSNAAWIAYYMKVSPNPHHALVWTISLVSTALLYLAYLRFLRFMERP